ncbi:MAG TPA: hypothetical protein VMH22_12605 [bacterium]|nr:hypothetical protein [bacterium]
MTKATRESLFTLAYVAAGMAAVLIVGYLTFHHRFFHMPRPLLPFLIVGLAGSLMYAVVQMRGAGLGILMIVLLYLIQVAMMPPIRPYTLASAAVYALPVGFALMAGAYAQKALGRRLKIGRFTVMGLILAAGYGLMMVLFLIRSRYDIHAGTVFGQAFIGFKLGAAMGLGFELVDLVGPRPQA